MGAFGAIPSLAAGLLAIETATSGLQHSRSRIREIRRARLASSRGPSSVAPLRGAVAVSMAEGVGFEPTIRC